MNLHRIVQLRVEAFLESSGMSASALGLAACGDGSVVAKLRQGDNLTLRRAQSLIDEIERIESERRAKAS